MNSMDDLALPDDFPDRATFEAEWVAALRSGEYQQGRYDLHPNTTWCCLGVACDIAIRHGIGRWIGECYVAPNGERTSSSLPALLRAYLNRDGGGAPPNSHDTLAGLNDSGVPFAVIAGVIEGTITYEDAAKAGDAAS